MFKQGWILDEVSMLDNTIPFQKCGQQKKALQCLRMLIGPVALATRTPLTPCGIWRGLRPTMRFGSRTFVKWHLAVTRFVDRLEVKKYDPVYSAPESTWYRQTILNGMKSGSGFNQFACLSAFVSPTLLKSKMFAEFCRLEGNLKQAMHWVKEWPNMSRVCLLMRQHMHHGNSGLWLQHGSFATHPYLEPSFWRGMGFNFRAPVCSWGTGGCAHLREAVDFCGLDVIHADGHFPRKRTCW